MLEQIALALMAAISCLGLFAFLSASVVAVLWGPNRGPAFIRKMSYLYSRPTSAFEWFGFGVAVAIAAGTQLAVLGLTNSSYEPAFGAAGRTILQLELVIAALWLVYLDVRYRRPPR